MPTLFELLFTSRLVVELEFCWASSTCDSTHILTCVPAKKYHKSSARLVALGCDCMTRPAQRQPRSVAGGGRGGDWTGGEAGEDGWRSMRSEEAKGQSETTEHGEAGHLYGLFMHIQYKTNKVYIK
jgi:hypothetical protein